MSNRIDPVRRRLFRTWSVILLTLSGSLDGQAAEERAAVNAAQQTAASVEHDAVTADLLRLAVRKSIPLLEEGSRGAIAQRPQCFTCHNTGLVVLALSTALDQGFEIDMENYVRQVQFTADFLQKNEQGYRNGRGQGGAAMTAGYALWTLKLAGWHQDSRTTAVVDYLLQHQEQLGHWKSVSSRPPSEQGEFSATWLALTALDAFGTEDQSERIQSRRQQAREWLLTASGEDTEDRVFRLWGLQTAGAPAEELGAASRLLLNGQRSDGGWAQREDMDSDAYATGTVLVSLRAAGGISSNHSEWRKGIAYLLRTQQEDGSWYVKSRSRPFQTHFESGYPHGTDQFISIAAAGWATTALILALPEAEPGG